MMKPLSLATTPLLWKPDMTPSHVQFTEPPTLPSPTKLRVNLLAMSRESHVPTQHPDLQTLRSNSLPLPRKRSKTYSLDFNRSSSQPPIPQGLYPSLDRSDMRAKRNDTLLSHNELNEKASADNTSMSDPLYQIVEVKIIMYKTKFVDDIFTM